MTVLPGYKASVNVSTGVSTATTNEAMTDVGGLHTTFQVTNKAHMFIDPTVAVVVQTSPDGTTWTTQTSGFTLQYCGGIVVFVVAVTGATPSCRLSSANYLVTSQAALAKSVDIIPQVDIIDVSTFAGGAWKQKMALLGDATVKLSQWASFDGFYLTNINNMLVIQAFSGANANQQLACYAFLKTNNIKFDVKNATEQNLDFESHGPVLYLQS